MGVPGPPLPLLLGQPPCNVISDVCTFMEGTNADLELQGQQC